jgi:hypothetical protein
MGHTLAAVTAGIEHSEMAGGRKKPRYLERTCLFINFFTDSALHCA